MTKVNNTTVSIYGFRDDWITEESISRLQNSPPTSDIIIWLTYLEKIDPGELLVQLKNITPDLILEGNIEYTNPAPDTIQGIPVLRCGAEGMDVLEVDVFRVGEGFQFKPTWHQ